MERELVSGEWLFCSEKNSTNSSEECLSMAENQGPDGAVSDANETSHFLTVSSTDLDHAHRALTKVLSELDKILLGNEQVHQMLLVGILAKGHVLLEGQPGVGKTTLAKALGQLLNLEFNRVQFTPDLMPNDILGSHILQQKQDDDGNLDREMVFQKGPIFTNILLADEINRASPKTQSAMLEAMQERCVTLMGKTHKLPEPLLIIASQNPIDLEGTYPLPEAQLDRFLFKLQVGKVDRDVLGQLILSRRHGNPPIPEFSMSKDELLQLFNIVDQIFLPKPVAAYIARLVEASHPDFPDAIDDIKQYVSYGNSARAAIAMAEAGRALALINGRPSIGFEDIDAVAPHIMAHRLILNYKAGFDKVTGYDLVKKLLESTDKSELSLPSQISVS